MIKITPICCKARQYSDQKYCDRCGFTWDVNDPEPPKCLSDQEVKEGRHYINITFKVN